MSNKQIKTKYGYVTFEKLPSVEELQKHYAEKYYQASGDYNSGSTYSTSYPPEEIAHRNFISKLTVEKALQLMPNAKIAFDLGCGEGFLVKSFFEHGLTCYCMDFSSFGISQFNPEYIDYFEQGDILDFTIANIDPQEIDIVSCMNVLEHVLDPETLFKKFHSDFKKGAIFAIKVPNDFSELHKYLEENNKINRQFWIEYPEHLSYFNKENFNELALDFGFEIQAMIADYPIDLLLLNDALNYVNDKSKGPAAHQYRVETDLFLSKFDTAKVISLYEAYANLGIGRNLTYFMRKK